MRYSVGKAWLLSAAIMPCFMDMGGYVLEYLCSHE